MLLVSGCLLHLRCQARATATDSAVNRWEGEREQGKEGVILAACCMYVRYAWNDMHTDRTPGYLAVCFTVWVWWAAAD
jgi:hypothetical protein